MTAVFAALLSFDASAAELKVPLCTTQDCGPMVLVGRLNKSDRCCGFQNLSMPWVAQVYANKNECLWLRVTEQGSDSEIVVVAPATARAWRNDSSKDPACKTCPLLKIITSAQEAGWFLVQVNQNQGAALDAEFTLEYGRYKSNNPICSSPSTPLHAP